MRHVPDLSYMSVWTNDSGAGFEHTASLYVGRNGGPYMIREWRNHDKVAQAAGESIVRYLKNLQGAAAELNPDFDVILRIEPFKVVEMDPVPRNGNRPELFERLVESARAERITAEARVKRIDPALGETLFEDAHEARYQQGHEQDEPNLSSIQARRHLVLSGRGRAGTSRDSP
jgi:hypothetical protein